MTDCVILAAGFSTRMGRPKLHLPFGSSTILGTTIDGALAAGCRVIIVGRVEDEALEGYASERVLVERNPAPERGMISTLRVGIARVETARFFFIPGDMPLVRATTWERLLSMETGLPVIPVAEGRRGHPVLLPSALIPDILGLPEGTYLKSLIEAASPLLLEVEDPGILADIDDPAAYEAAMNAYRH
jgi:molybdenum cofactor cytidylyltransferase